MKTKLMAVLTIVLAVAALWVITSQSASSSATTCNGAAYMGCSVGAKAAPTAPKNPTVAPPVTGCVYPDVSNYQRALTYADWSAASSHICAVVAKAGQSGYGEDPSFAHFVATFRELKIPWSAYYFVTSCYSGPEFVSILNSVGFKNDRDALVPVLDMEVPSAHNCAVPLAAAVHKAFGVWPVIYTAPGTWPGGCARGL